MSTTTAASPADIATSVLRWAGLITAWSIQYGVYVWLVLIGRAFQFVLKLGALGILLLCIPVVGWIILAVLLLRRPAPADPNRRNIWRPWFTPVNVG